MNCALVGTTKIASIHLKELLKVNFKKIYIVSRRKEKAENFLKKYKFKDKRISIVSKSILSKKISCVDICVSTKYHHIFLNYLKKKKSFIIMEKPIISFTLFRKNFLYEIDKIFKRLFKDIYIFNKVIILFTPIEELMLRVKNRLHVEHGDNLTYEKKSFIKIYNKTNFYHIYNIFFKIMDKNSIKYKILFSSKRKFVFCDKNKVISNLKNYYKYKK